MRDAQWPAGAGPSARAGLPLRLSSTPLQVVIASETSTTSAPIYGVCMMPRCVTIRPPDHAAAVMPRLNAAILKPDATSTACGASRLMCAVNGADGAGADGEREKSEWHGGLSDT